MTEPRPPLCWVLINASTLAPIGGTSVYIRQEAAAAMAKAMTNRWRSVVAIAVYGDTTQIEDRHLSEAQP